VFFYYFQPENLEEPALKHSKIEQPHLAPDVSDSENCVHKKISKALFLIDLPEDFYDFYHFICSYNKCHHNSGFDLICIDTLGRYFKCDFIDILKTLNLKLGSIFHATFAENSPELDQNQAVLLDRYYFDPPEVQTILTHSKNDPFHIGYYR